MNPMFQVKSDFPLDLKRDFNYDSEKLVQEVCQTISHQN